MWRNKKLCIWLSWSGRVGKNPPAQAGGMGLIPGRGYSTSRTATKPTCRNYWTRALETTSCAATTEALSTRAHGLQKEEPPQWEACEPHEEQPLLTATRENPCSNKDPAQSKINNKQAGQLRYKKFIKRSYASIIIKLLSTLFPNNRGQSSLTTC